MASAFNSNRTRRVSIGTLGTQEMILLETQWDLLQGYVKNAELQYDYGNRQKAMELCNKALHIMPDYLPAMKLHRVLTQHEQSSTACGGDVVAKEKLISESEDEVTVEDSSTGIDTSSSSVEAPGPVHSTPMPKSKLAHHQSSRRGIQWDAPVSSSKTKEPIKGILKRSSSTGNLSIEHAVQERARTRQSARHERETETDKPSWSKIKDMLMTANKGDTDPRNFYLQLAVLWDSSTRRFHCWYPQCKFSGRTRLDAIHHTLQCHFPQGTKPFFCKSCKSGKPTMDVLLAHAIIEHPNSRWLKALQDIIRGD